MDEAEEVESYSSAAAAKHLDAIDNTLVAHVLRLLCPQGVGNGGSQRSITEAAPARGDFQGAHQAKGAAKACPEVPVGRASPPVWGLDIGTGPAEIPIKLLRKIPDLRMVGIDRSMNMLDRARQNAQRETVSERLALVVADGHLLPFRDGIFSMALCNSVLHHAREPVQLLREMVRVAALEAPLLLRDLRRPSRLFLRWHLWRHGRHYQGLMRKLFEDSVRAAYTLGELEEFVRKAKMEGLCVFRFRGAHIGIERRKPPRS